MPASLSTGSVAEIMNGSRVDKPVLQLLALKKLATPGPNGGISERYRLLLSDGVNSCTFAMLATQLNFHVANGDLDKFAIIRMDNYVLNRPQPTKKVLVVLDLVILNSGSEVGSQIGNPVPVGNPSNQENQDCNPSDSKDAGTHNVNNNFEMETKIKKEPISKVTPQSNFYKPFQEKPGSGGFPSKQRAVHSIANLMPYTNRWTVRARVTNKPPIRTWHNARGEGKLFSVDLLDESGEIRATGFNEQSDQFYEKLVVNKVYYISNATLKTANRNFTSIKHDYEMTFKAETLVEPCEDSVDEIPIINFAFVPISELVKMEKNTVVDVIGVCKRYGELQTLIARTTSRELKKRDIFLVDSSNVEVTLSIWDEAAEQFDGSSNPIVAIKGVRISDFGGCSLSTTSSCTFLINPDTPEANALSKWFALEGSNSVSNSISKVGSGGFSTNWKYLQQAKLDGLASSDKAEYFTAKAVVVFTKVENCMYMACPTADCNKKVIDQNNGFYRCEKCNKEFDSYKWRLLLNVNVADFSDTVWVTCFQECAEEILGATSKELGDLKNSNPDEFTKAIQKANFKQFIFKLRAKMENFQDETRLKVSAVSVSPVKFLDYNKKLIEELKGMV